MNSDAYWKQHNAIVEALLDGPAKFGFPNEDEARKTINDAVNNTYHDGITNGQWQANALRRLCGA